MSRAQGERLKVTTPVAEPRPLIAMKLQAVRYRPIDKQGADLIDILRLNFDQATRSVALAQIGAVDAAIGGDVGLHVDLWFARRLGQ